MPSSKEYLDFILEQLSDIPEISYRPMMGEYILYYKGKVIGGIYDQRFLIKPVKSAVEMIADARFEEPYPGGKNMILVDEIENRDFLKDLFDRMFDELPETKKKRTKKEKQ